VYGNIIVNPINVDNKNSKNSKKREIMEERG
jgi:hypothetical protein